MRLLRAATLTVPDPSATAQRYERWMDYVRVEEGEVSDDLAKSWGTPASGGRRFVTLRPASGAAVFLRFIQGAIPAEYKPLRTYGWAAIEICVRDVLAVNDRMASSPFEIIGPPKQIEGLPAIFPMQVRGPDDEIAFLTEIRDDLPEYDLPRAASLIDTLFILVLACEDLSASLDWFERNLGLRGGRKMDLVYSVINQAFGLPPEMLHTIATMTHERDVFLELDQYPSNTVARPFAPGELPPGVAIASFAHPDIRSLPAAWISAPVARPGPLYEGNLVGCLRAPGGALVEVVGSAPR